MKITDVGLILVAILLVILLTCATKSSKTYVLPSGHEVRCRSFKAEGSVVVLSDCDDDRTYLVASRLLEQNK